MPVTEVAVLVLLVSAARARIVAPDLGNVVGEPGHSRSPARRLCCTASSWPLWKGPPAVDRTATVGRERQRMGKVFRLGGVRSSKRLVSVLRMLTETKEISWQGICFEYHCELARECASLLGPPVGGHQTRVAGDEARGDAKMIDRRGTERRVGDRRYGARRGGERRQRPIPVVVDLRNGPERRELSDRRQLADRRINRERRYSTLDDRKRCTTATADGTPCDRRALLRGSDGQGWICLEHLVIPNRLNVN